MRMRFVKFFVSLELFLVLKGGMAEVNVLVQHHFALYPYLFINLLFFISNVKPSEDFCRISQRVVIGQDLILLLLRSPLVVELS